jgi:ADP-ribose pyrophosphatase YjhB (NUDIX family)
MNSKKLCANCGRGGHSIKKCTEPINSYGIICFSIDENINIKNREIENYFYNKFIDMDEFNYNNLENIKYLSFFYDKIKILLVRRKHSLNYVDFIRGKYDENNKEQLSKMFHYMSYDENIKIKNNNLENLWNDLWKNTAELPIYKKEFCLSLKKFGYLKEHNFFDLLDNNKLSQYSEPEWEFPKGRRNYFEKNLNCAIREFYEETNINKSKIHILERLNNLEEEYIGTNLIQYKHIYYLASSEDRINNEEKIQLNNNEIESVCWFTIPELLEKIRPYYETKIKLIHQIYFFVINLIIKLNKNNSFNNLEI